MTGGSGDRDSLPGRGPVTTGRRVAQVMAVLPIVAWVVLMIVDRGFLAPLYQSPPEALGLPLGVVILVVTAGWAAIGLAIIQTSRVALIWILAIVVFTVPALLALVLEPAIIVIIRNITT